MLSDVFATITSALPTIKISKWDVQVLKEQKLKQKSDGFISAVRNTVKNAIDWVQDTVAGLFQNIDSSYTSICDFDSFISFNGSHDTQVVQNAVENGSFRSVNKIKKPNTCVIELAKGGYRSDIENVLSNLKAYQGSIKTFRVMTPFGNMDNLNLIKLEYQYTRDNGSNLLIAKLTFQEIIYGSVTGKYENIKVNTPDKTNTENTGNKALANWRGREYKP